MISSYMQGAGLGAGLIIAIGAQNAFVLSQGIRKQHRWLIPSICSLCDCLLILAGVAGLGTLVATNPYLSKLAGWGGATFLIIYGAKSLVMAFKNNALELDTPLDKTTKSAIITTLGLTLLNPHVYLDTVVLLGSISGQFSGTKRYIFALGACSASILWFYSLSFAGSLLQPLFKHHLSWKILDIFICLTMWTIAFSIWPRGT